MSTSRFARLAAPVLLLSVTSGCPAPDKSAPPARFPLARVSATSVSTARAVAPEVTPASRTPRCVLRSGVSLETSVRFDVRAGGEPFAERVSGEVEVSIFDGDHVTVRAVKNGIVLEGDAGLSQVVFRRTTERRASWFEPALFAAVSFYGGVLEGSIAPPRGLTIEPAARDVLRNQYVPCAEASFGLFPPEPRERPAAPVRLRSKGKIALRAVADGPEVAELERPEEVGPVEIVAASGGRTRVRFLERKSDAFVEAWVESGVLARMTGEEIEKRWPSPGLSNEVMIHRGGPTIDVHVCARDLPLSVETKKGLRSVGRVKAGTRIAFGPASGTRRPVVGAGIRRVETRFFSPMTLPPELALLADEQDIDHACEEVGSEPLLEP